MNATALILIAAASARQTPAQGDDRAAIGAKTDDEETKPKERQRKRQEIVGGRHARLGEEYLVRKGQDDGAPGDESRARQRKHDAGDGRNHHDPGEQHSDTADREQMIAARKHPDEMEEPRRSRHVVVEEIGIELLAVQEPYRRNVKLLVPPHLIVHDTQREAGQQPHRDERQHHRTYKYPSRRMDHGY